MASAEQTVPGSAPGLRRDAIGLREVLFQSITDMAPGAAIAASIPAGALYAGGAARRGPGRRWNPLLPLIIPLLGIAAFVPAWLTSAGIRVFSFVAPLTAPSSYMGPGVAGFMVVGVIYLIYLYARHPRRVTEVGLVHLDEPVVAEAEATT